MAEDGLLTMREFRWKVHCAERAMKLLEQSRLLREEADRWLAAGRSGNVPEEFEKSSGNGEEAGAGELT